jgi:hypothetical protein
MRYLILLSVVCLPLAAYAQTVEQDGKADNYSLATERAQNTFLAYQGALEAARKCQHRSIDGDELLGLDRKIAAEMTAVAPNVAIGAARLQNLRRDAESDMDRRVRAQGCNGPDPTTALDRFSALQNHQD